MVNKYNYDEQQAINTKELLQKVFSESEVTEILQIIESEVQKITTQLMDNFGNFTKSMIADELGKFVLLKEKDGENFNQEKFFQKSIMKIDFVREAIKDSIISSIITNWYPDKSSKINDIVKTTYKLYKAGEEKKNG